MIVLALLIVSGLPWFASVFHGVAYNHEKIQIICAKADGVEYVNFTTSDNIYRDWLSGGYTYKDGDTTVTITDGDDCMLIVTPKTGVENE